MSALAAHGVAWGAQGRMILEDVDLSARPGEVLGVIGPNGAGKTTLLRMLAGLRTPGRGHVTLDGVRLDRLARRELARGVAIVEQMPEAHAEITVAEAVALGRIPYRGALSGTDPGGSAAIGRALALTGLERLREAPWRTLSGGERQRTQLARALAQESRVLLLDEPTNHLDIRHQLGILQLLRELQGTAVAALHDLSLAARFCDRIAVLHRGRIVACGTPADVLTAALLREVYGVEAVVERSVHTGAMTVTYLGVGADADVV